MNKNTQKNTPSGKALGAIAVVLFLVATLIHIVCGDFPKNIDVLPDEMRYLDTARSLFSGNGLIMRGEPSTFQKILYPLSLFPALMFPDGETQVRAINVLNSIYACSAVFPALLIARELFRRPLPIIACMVFTLILPDLMYSMTFMTESIFLPLSLWVIFACWHCFQAKGRAELALAGGVGLLCYITYLCKEVAWMYLIAFLAWYIVAMVQKRRSLKRGICAVALCAAGFFIPFIAMKLTLFAGLSNSYSQLSYDIFFTAYNTLFGLYSVAVDSVYFIIGFGVFPVLYLFLVYRDLPRKDRDLLFFCLASLVIGLGVVVITISMREDVGHVALRQHLRYVTPLSLPMLFLFIKQVLHFDPVVLRENPRRWGLLVGVTVGFCALVMAFFGSANLRQGFDFSQFHVVRWLLDQAEALPQQRFEGWTGNIADIPTDDGDLLVINALDWALRAIVIAYTAVGMWLLTRASEKVRQRTGIAICSVIAVFMVANSVALFHYDRGAYGAEQTDVDEIVAINEQLAEHAGSSDIVIVLEEGNTKHNDLIDTYIQDGAGEYRYLTLKNFRKEDDYGSVDFILAGTGQNVDFVSKNLRKIGGVDDGRFVLYEVSRG